VRPPFQFADVEHADSPAAELDGRPLLLVPKHLVHRRPRRARDLGDRLLCQPDHGQIFAAVETRQLHEPPAYPLLDRDVERLEQTLVENANLVREEAEKHRVDLRMPLPHVREVVAIDGDRLRFLERSDGRRSARLLGDERHLAEALTRAAHRDRRSVPERRHHADCEAAALDQVHAVPRIVAVEDHLVARETPPARDLQQLAHLLRRHSLQEAPLDAAHDPTMS
jgi:hypothetical protein